MHKLFLLSAALCLSNAGKSQSNVIEPPKLAVKWSLLHLVYFYPSIQVGLEHKLYKRLNIQYDLGWVINVNPDAVGDYEDKKGFRGIAELRYYIPSPPKIPFYVAGEFYYSRISFNRSEVMGYQCETGNCSYFRQVTYKMENDHQGVGLKYGILLFPGWNRQRSFFFDINGGVAYRNIAYHEIGKPYDPAAKFFDNDSDNFFAPKESDHSEFRLIVGVRIAYAFL